MPTIESELREVTSWLRDAQRIVVLTGAGISTDSGIPDFRGPNGLWTKNPGAEKMATLSHYVSDKAVRERSWQHRLESPMWSAQPNEGHKALARLESLGNLELLITQNVDGLHLLAGTSPGKLVEIHGNVREVTCLDCGERAPMERALARVRNGEADPPCRSCGGSLKSATISFGQGLVAHDLQRAEQAANARDLQLAVGTTLSVYPIAAVVPIAKRGGARVVIVNAEATEMDDLGDAVIRGPISVILPRIIPSE